MKETINVQSICSRAVQRARVRCSARGHGMALEIAGYSRMVIALRRPPVEWHGPLALLIGALPGVSLM